MPSVQKGLIVGNWQLSKDLYEIEFIAPKMAEECSAGQFLQVQLSENYDPMLRRPLSIYDVDSSLGSISLLYKVVGRGTEMISKLKPKEFIDVMGPLGKGFSISTESKKCLLVGGGVGIAPLIYLARVLKENHKEVIILHGADNRKQLVSTEKMRSMGVDYYFATDDGSSGFKGYISDLMREKIAPEGIDFIYTCGPEIMMSEVAKYANEYGIEGEVSLEEHMACGVGACLGCARKLKKDDQAYIKVCKDGPVFNIKDVEF